MVVLIDTNASINFIIKRSDPQLEAIIDVMKLCANDEIDGFFTVLDSRTCLLYNILTFENDVDMR